MNEKELQLFYNDMKGRDLHGGLSFSDFSKKLKDRALFDKYVGILNKSGLEVNDSDGMYNFFYANKERVPVEEVIAEQQKDEIMNQGASSESTFVDKPDIPEIAKEKVPVEEREMPDLGYSVDSLSQGLIDPAESLRTEVQADEVKQSLQDGANRDQLEKERARMFSTEDGSPISSEEATKNIVSAMSGTIDDVISQESVDKTDQGAIMRFVYDLGEGYSEGMNEYLESQSDAFFISSNLAAGDTDLIIEKFEDDFKKMRKKIPKADAGMFSAKGISKMIGSESIPISIGVGAGVGGSLLTTPVGGLAIGATAGATDAALSSFGATFRANYFRLRSQGLDKEGAMNSALNTAYSAAVGGALEGAVGSLPLFKGVGKFLSRGSQGLTKDVLGYGGDALIDGGVASINQVAQNIFAANQGVKVGATEGAVDAFVGEAFFGALMNTKTFATAGFNDLMSITNAVRESNADIDKAISNVEKSIESDVNKDDIPESTRKRKREVLATLRAVKERLDAKNEAEDKARANSLTTGDPDIDQQVDEVIADATGNTNFDDTPTITPDVDPITDRVELEDQLKKDIEYRDLLADELKQYEEGEAPEDTQLDYDYYDGRVKELEARLTAEDQATTEQSVETFEVTNQGDADQLEVNDEIDDKIDQLNEDDYIDQGGSSITDFGRSHAKGEGRDSAIESIQSQARGAKKYAKGEVTAKDFLIDYFGYNPNLKESDYEESASKKLQWFDEKLGLSESKDQKSLTPAETVTPPLEAKTDREQEVQLDEASSVEDSSTQYESNKDFAAKNEIDERYSFLGETLDELGVSIREVDGVDSSIQKDKDGKISISIGRDTDNKSEKFAHEAIHAMMMGATKSQRGKLNQKLSRFRGSLSTEAENNRQGLIDAFDGDEAQAQFFLDAMTKDKVDEVVTYPLTNPKVAQWLNSIPADPTKPEGATVWTEFKRIIKEIIGSQAKNTKLDELNQIMDESLDLALTKPIFETQTTETNEVRQEEGQQVLNEGDDNQQNVIEQQEVQQQEKQEVLGKNVQKDLSYVEKQVKTKSKYRNSKLKDLIDKYEGSDDETSKRILEAAKKEYDPEYGARKKGRKPSKEKKEVKESKKRGVASSRIDFFDSFSEGEGRAIPERKKVFEEAAKIEEEVDNSPLNPKSPDYIKNSPKAIDEYFGESDSNEGLVQEAKAANDILTKLEELKNDPSLDADDRDELDKISRKIPKTHTAFRKVGKKTREKSIKEGDLISAEKEVDKSGRLYGNQIGNYLDQKEKERKIAKDKYEKFLREGDKYDKLKDSTKAKRRRPSIDNDTRLMATDEKSRTKIKEEFEEKIKQEYEGLKKNPDILQEELDAPLRTKTVNGQVRMMTPEEKARVTYLRKLAAEDKLTEAKSNFDLARREAKESRKEKPKKEVAKEESETKKKDEPSPSDIKKANKEAEDLLNDSTLDLDDDFSGEMGFGFEFFNALEYTPGRVFGDSTTKRSNKNSNVTMVTKKIRKINKESKWDDDQKSNELKEFIDAYNADPNNESITSREVDSALKKVSSERKKQALAKARAQRESDPKWIKNQIQNSTASMENKIRSVNDFMSKVLPSKTRGRIPNKEIRDALSMIANSETPTDLIKAVDRVMDAVEKSKSEAFKSNFDKTKKSLVKKTKGTPVFQELSQNLDFNDMTFESLGRLNEIMSGFSFTDTKKVKDLDQWLKDQRDVREERIKEEIRTGSNRDILEVKDDLSKLKKSIESKAQKEKIKIPQLAKRLGISDQELLDIMSNTVDLNDLDATDNLVDRVNNEIKSRNVEQQVFNEKNKYKDKVDSAKNKAKRAARNIRSSTTKAAERVSKQIADYIESLDLDKMYNDAFAEIPSNLTEKETKKFKTKRKQAKKRLDEVISGLNAFDVNERPTEGLVDVAISSSAEKRVSNLIDAIAKNKKISKILEKGETSRKFMDSFRNINNLINDIARGFEDAIDAIDETFFIPIKKASAYMQADSALQKEGFNNLIRSLNIPSSKMEGYMIDTQITGMILDTDHSFESDPDLFARDIDKNIELLEKSINNKEAQLSKKSKADMFGGKDSVKEEIAKERAALEAIKSRSQAIKDNGVSAAFPDSKVKAIYDYVRDNVLKNYKEALKTNEIIFRQKDLEDRPYYFPRLAEGKANQTAIEIMKESEEEMARQFEPPKTGESENAERQAGSTKARSVREAVQLGTFYSFDTQKVIEGYIDDATFDLYMTPAIRETVKVMRDPRAKEALGDNLERVRSGLINMTRGAKGRVRQYNGFVSFMEKVKNNYVTTTLGGYYQWMNQFATMIPTVASISPKAFAKASSIIIKGSNLNNNMSVSDWFSEYAPSVRAADARFEKFEASRSRGGFLARKLSVFGQERAKNLQTEGLVKSDRASRELTFLTAFLAEGGDMNNPDPKILRRADRTVDRIQNVSDPNAIGSLFQASENWKRALVSIAYSFKSFAVNQNLNAIDAVRFFRNDPAKQAGVIGQTVLNNLSYTLISKVGFDLLMQQAREAVTGEEEEDKKVGYEVAQGTIDVIYDTMLGGLMPDSGKYLMSFLMVNLYKAMNDGEPLKVDGKELALGSYVPRTAEQAITGSFGGYSPIARLATSGVSIADAIKNGDDEDLNRLLIKNAIEAFALSPIKGLSGSKVGDLMTRATPDLVRVGRKMTKKPEEKKGSGDSMFDFQLSPNALSPSSLDALRGF